MHKKEQLTFTTNEPDSEWHTDLISGVIVTAKASRDV